MAAAFLLALAAVLILSHLDRRPPTDENQW